MTENENIQNVSNELSEDIKSQDTSEAFTEFEPVNRNEKFISALRSVNRTYLYTVITAGALAAASIAIAVLLNIAAGLTAAISVVLFYMIVTKGILAKKLGISHKSTSGELSIASVSVHGEEELWISSRLLWLDVTEIEKEAFKAEGAEELRTLHLPATLKLIGEDAFSACEKLECIYFQGSAEDWEAISKPEVLSEIAIIFNDDSLYSVPKKPKKPKKQKKQKDEQASQTAETKNSSATQAEDENK